ncbi:MAG: cysteine--tRNA ligase [Actinomycetota bacterium]|nr:cysteine--tRNA ligase [Actinomycetota bacterium]
MAGMAAGSSGVMGRAGRFSAPEDAAPRSAGLRIGGRSLPLVSPARIYICGITPYDVTHLGHAATFVWADVAASVMRLAGVEVQTCRNVTDVDDVLTRAADKRGRPYDEFALSQEYLFEQDMRLLSVRRPTYEPRARHHIPHVVQLGLALQATGAAYEREGHLFFRGAAVVGGLDRDDALDLAREYGDGPDDPLRDNPFDVPVWRPSGDDDPAWPSPWGWGRPGWHAECAAMAHAVFGPGVDLLAGGADLVFPHHAYQAAMAEAATGVAPFSRSRLSVGTVCLDGRKMAKSTGNLTLVQDLIGDHPAAAVRLLLLSRAWGTTWDFHVEDLAAAAERLDRLYAAAGRPNATEAATEAVVAALLSDLNVPTALDVAEAEGGAAARHLLGVLALG